MEETEREKGNETAGKNIYQAKGGGKEILSQSCRGGGLRQTETDGAAGRGEAETEDGGESVIVSL